MTVTLEQAKTENEFHVGHLLTSRGYVPWVWGRSGKTKLWKTRPNAFRIPVKYGSYLYAHSADGMPKRTITDADEQAYVARLCPFCR